MAKRAVTRVSDKDLANFIPQYKAVLDILRSHKLGWPLEDLAGEIALKVTAVTWAQVTEAAPELTAVNRG